MRLSGVGVALTILVGALFASSSVHECTTYGIPTDYLPLPDEDNSNRNALWDEVLSKDTRPAGLAPEKMLEDFEQRSRVAPSARERAFAKQMHQVGVRRLDACNALTHRFVYEILSLAKQYPNAPVLANHITYIKTIGKAKYAECAATVPLLFDLRASLTRYGNYARLDFLEAEDAMDMFFAAYANSKETRLDDEQQLYEVAKRANLAEGNFKEIGRILKIAKEQMSSKFLASKPSKFDIFRSFWDNACTVLMHPFEVEFGNYNIAAALGSPLPNDIPTRFLKINEYRRICMAYGDAEDKNLQRQVESAGSKGKWYKFGKN